MRLAAWIGLGIAVTSPAPVVADICGPGAVVDFPLSVVLDDKAHRYMSEAYDRVDWDRLDPEAMAVGTDEFVQVLAERSAELPPALADLPYLLVLGAQVEYDQPLQSLTFGAQASVLPQVVQALERQGLVAEAALVQVPLGLYPDWQAGPDARMQELIALGSDLPAGLRGQALQAASAALRHAAPKVRAAVAALIAKDSALAAAFEAERQSASVEWRLDHLIHRLQEDCLPHWWTPEEADAAFAAMGPEQRDILLLHGFYTARYSETAEQYFQNPEATLAPQVASLLDRLGLVAPAAALRTGMAAFAAPYPRDTDARRAAMARFTADEVTSLRALVLWPDHAGFADVLVNITEAAGLMPR